MDEMKISYGVFSKAYANAYDPDPQWELFSGWYDRYDIARQMLEYAKRNIRCAELKIAKRTETHEDVSGTLWKREAQP